MIPYIQINWNKKGNNKLYFNNDFFKKTDGISISYEKKSFDLDYFENTERIILIFGETIIKDKIDNSNVINKLLNIDLNKSDDFKKYLKNINGQFLILIIAKDKNEFYIVNDRFNGIPVYYSNLENNLIISHLYFDLFKYLRIKNDFHLNQNSILEFLWFNRVFGEDTYDNLSKFMMPANIISIKKNIFLIEKYWFPNFKKSNLSISQASKKFIFLLKQSIKRLTSDNKKYGIFLSGGHDSRLIISSFDNPPTSFTVGFSKNFEAICAKEIARKLNTKNIFIKLNKDHFTINLDKITRICGGQFTFYDAIFTGLEAHYFNNVDYIFHGHGLDYLFQGMYLPTEYYKILSSPIFFKKHKFQYMNLNDEFINRIKYRIKGFDITSIYKNQFKENILDNFKIKIDKIIQESKNFTNDNLDIWEFIIFHSLGRHYSRANIISKQSCGKQRTPIFDNDIFNFYLSLKLKHKINSAVVRHAINSINPYIGKIPTGNWGFPAGDSPLIKTFKLIFRKILRIITKNKKYTAPLLKDRTWPDRELLIKNNIELKNEIRNMFCDIEFKLALNKIDWNKLEKNSIKWTSNEDGGSSFLIALLSVYKLFILAK